MSDLFPEDEKKRIKEKAFRYLAGRAHSEKELYTKLKLKGFPDSLITEVIVELKEAKFLNDVEFALSFARSRIHKKPMGERLLRQELWKKGLKKELIDNTIRAAYSEKSQDEIARELVQKRIARYENLDESKQKKRLNDFLLRRGFDWELIKEVIAEKI